MQIILIDKVVNLGNLGDVVKVKDGYARNFLIPTGRARRATQANIDAFAVQKIELERVAAAKLDEARARGQARRLCGKNRAVGRCRWSFVWLGDQRGYCRSTHERRG